MNPTTSSAHDTATAVVFNHAGRVLLVDHIAYGLRVFPGGHVDDGESAAEAAVREVWEEAHIQIQLVGDGPLQQAVYDSAPYPDEPAHQHLDWLFVGRVVGDESLVPQDDEVSGAHWVALDDLSTMPVRAEVPAAARLAFDLIRAAHIDWVR